MAQMVIDTLALGRAIYWDQLTISMDEHEKQYTQILSEAHTTQQFERIGQLTGLGYPQYAVEGSPIANDSRRTLYTQDFYPALYGISYEWTDIAEYTDQYNKFKENPMLAAKSMSQGRELAGANVLNNGFSSSFVGADGVALFSTAHPTNGGATWSNRPSSALALGTSSLKQAKSEMRRVKDPRNMPMGFKGNVMLVVPPELEVTADILLTSSTIPFAANFGDNHYKDRVTKKLVIDELTSSTAWYLISEDKSKHGLFMLYGLPLSVETQRTAVTKSTIYVTAETRVTGWKHPYGTWGTPGG